MNPQHGNSRAQQNTVHVAIVIPERDKPKSVIPATYCSTDTNMATVRSQDIDRKSRTCEGNSREA